MRQNRIRIVSVTLPVALVILIQALAFFPTKANAQCPTLGEEGATFGITKFNAVKAQMWYNDGVWWGAFSDNDTGIHFYSFPNNAATQGPIIDGNINGIPDALWDNTNLFVFIWKSVSLATLYKYTYDPGTKAYNLVSGFPVQVPLNGSATSAIVMDKDSTGKLWATYTGTQGGLSDGKVRVIWSTSADHKTWDSTGLELETGLAPNTLEISAITHFGGNKIGIAWSNQPGKQIAFKYHTDGQPETSWSTKEVIDSGLGPRGLGPVADDHLAIKPLPDGRVFLLAKDNDNDGTPAHAIEGRLWLYVRTAAGVWGQKTIVQPDFSQLPTRPVLLIDNVHNTAYVIYHDESPSGSGRNFITHTDMNNLSFDFPCVFNITPSTNPTSTKQEVTPATGIMAAASTGTTGTGEIVFRGVDLNINSVPTITSLSPSSATAGGAAFTLTINGTGFVNTSVVQWNDVDQVTTYVSDTQLTIQVAAADIATAGTAIIGVFNPPPGGGFADPVAFNINPPVIGYEGDVAPRPNGSNNGSVSIADWVQTGRFASGLDIANVGSEYQRADTAPKASFGNGTISVSDWVQTGRYASGLDPVVSVGGPTGPPAGPVSQPKVRTSKPLSAVAREMRVTGQPLTAGQSGSVTIELDSQGDENALGFSVTFTTSQLTFVSAVAGPDAGGAVINTNANQAASGRIGVGMALPSGQAYTAGTRKLLTLNFNVAANASGSTVIGFGDQPIGREIVNVTADELTSSYTGATLNITGAGNPVPTVSTISPVSAVAGSSAFTLTVNGTNFINGSIVRWNGTDHTTSFVNSSQVTAQISAADIASAGSASVTVFNPTPGGGTSGAASFAINNPVPSTSGLLPSSATAGGSGFTLTVNGSNFVNGSVVRWNGSDRTTSFVNSTQVTAQISAGDIASAGSATVTVFNPTPAGGVSNSTSFGINNPLPAVSGISPSTAATGGPAFTLTVNGNNFVNSSVVRWNGSDRTTTFVNASQLTAQISAADIGSAGSANIAVFSPAPGGGTSNTSSLAINNPAPVASGLLPSNAMAGSAAFTLTVNGSGFINGSVIRWNGGNRTTTFVNSTQLTTQIAAADIATAGTASVTVFTGTPGGGTSSALTFTINAIPPDPPKLQFSTQSFSAGEGSGSAVITVTRTGDTSGTASVDFTISDPIGYAPCLAVTGAAAQNCDYTITAANLQFASGETSKTVSIPLVDDLYVEGNETVNLSLVNPIGATLGSANTAALTIQDNDSAVPSANPIDDAQMFVRQHYLDFLNREPDPGGLGYWSNQIIQCGNDAACIRSQRIGVSGAFFVELEFQETGSVVYRLYKASYGQRPTYAAFMPDRSQLVGGPQLAQSTIDFANRFVQRAAFKAVYPDSMTNTEFVNHLFDSAQLMNSAAQRQQEIDGLTGGSMTRAQVLLDVIETPEFKQREYNPSFVLMEYFGYLRRDPEQAGYDFWLNVLNNQDPNNYRGMICSFLTSAEYQQRFSSVVTRTNAECGQ